MEDAANGASLCALAGTPAEGKYVANRVALPGIALGGVPFARDLNGDGMPDNAYGAVAGHYGQSFNWQSAMDLVITSGRMLLLFDVMASDATFTTSACATVNLSRAQSSAGPMLDGSDALAVDAERGQAILRGSIASSVLDADFVPSNMPRVTLMLPLGPPVASPDGGTTPSGIAEIPVTVVHASFTETGSGLSKGQINGFISAADLRYALVPALAASLTALATALTGSTGSQILQSFDTGGTPDPACADACKDDDGGCSVAGDGIISSCEVATSTSGRNLLVPDVQMLAADGRYAPNPDNAEPDSFSIGLGFTAVRAAF